jgi:hypothetical protein
MGLGLARLVALCAEVGLVYRPGQGLRPASERQPPRGGWLAR